MDHDHLDNLLAKALGNPGGITALTGAGISAESNIPTFRGPEGYWTVGSRVYQPQEMATLAMFRKSPKAVWQWYLYRLGVCRKARPNAGHRALVELAQAFPHRFTLVTQNVDNLHLRAGQQYGNMYQIHGNIEYVRCSAECRSQIAAMPSGISAKQRNQDISASEWALLHCKHCGGLLRPHVLWFDETYNEDYYHLESTLAAARQTTLLIIVGTSGATNLPNQVLAEVYGHGGAILDINIESNQFGHTVEKYPLGLSIRQTSAQALPWLTRRIIKISRESKSSPIS